MTSWPTDRLSATIGAALARRSLSPEHSAYVVDGLLFGSLRGIDTHGLRLLPVYLAELDGGRAVARPELRWHRAQAAAERLDAGNALGMVAGRVAADRAVALAGAAGVGAVAVGSSNHFGAASYYTVEMARRGLVALAFSNSDALVAPWNGVRPCFGTNPISIAVGGDDDEVFCADLATSQVSYSRVKHHRRQGQPLAPGWAVRADGADAAEPFPPPAAAAPAPAGAPGTPGAPSAPGAPGEVAALKPLGGYKGQCLGMAVEILCCLLTGMPFDHELSHLYDPPFDVPRQVAHLFIALDPGAFTDAASFRRRLAQRLRQVRAEPAAGSDPVLVPGDLERESEAARAAAIPLGDDELRALTALEAEARGA